MRTLEVFKVFCGLKAREMWRFVSSEELWTLVFIFFCCTCIAHTLFFGIAICMGDLDYIIDVINKNPVSGYFCLTMAWLPVLFCIYVTLRWLHSNWKKAEYIVSVRRI